VYSVEAIPENELIPRTELVSDFSQEVAVVDRIRIETRENGRSRKPTAESLLIAATLLGAIVIRSDWFKSRCSKFAK